MVIVIFWWLAFFVMLPIGVRSQLEEGNVVPGTEPSAPSAPNLVRKAIIAFAIALVAWAGLFALIEWQLVSLDDFPVPSGIRWK
ncbi:MAG: DUF1467 family protein [Alphaproteobacteria bacterium]|nr:DUF1467 family protein [Alphaproteobacteria bacterium]